MPPRKTHVWTLSHTKPRPVAACLGARVVHPGFFRRVAEFRQTRGSQGGRAYLTVGAHGPGFLAEDAAVNINLGPGGIGVGNVIASVDPRTLLKAMTVSGLPLTTSALHDSVVVVALGSGQGESLTIRRRARSRFDAPL